MYFSLSIKVLGKPHAFIFECPHVHELVFQNLDYPCTFGLISQPIWLNSYNPSETQFLLSNVEGGMDFGRGRRRKAHQVVGEGGWTPNLELGGWGWM
mgnify:CR=1 FL=1